MVAMSYSVAIALFLTDKVFSENGRKGMTMTSVQHLKNIVVPQIFYSYPGIVNILMIQTQMSMDTLMGLFVGWEETES